jgi:hypothetical protein
LFTALCQASITEPSIGWNTKRPFRINSLHEQPEPVLAPPAQALNPRQRAAIALVMQRAVLLQRDAVAPWAAWALERQGIEPLARGSI